MFVFSKGRVKTFNPLKEKTKRQGFEMLVHNKHSDGVNKKTLGGKPAAAWRNLSTSWISAFNVCEE